MTNNCHNNGDYPYWEIYEVYDGSIKVLSLWDARVNISDKSTNKYQRPLKFMTTKIEFLFNLILFGYWYRHHTMHIKDSLRYTISLYFSFKEILYDEMIELYSNHIVDR